ncbi:MAG TPA: hypothetical protein VFC19_41790 [Candidatus Limnocylindrales bacterium]|nr:hypothetical protein [Candidatus Limnocylindrales bacterium]
MEQNPTPRWNGKEPDYKIEGRYFDSYAPSTKDIDNVRDEISHKVRDPKNGLLQADRIVLDMQDRDSEPRRDRVAAPAGNTRPAPDVGISWSRVRRVGIDGHGAYIDDGGSPRGRMGIRLQPT